MPPDVPRRRPGARADGAGGPLTGARPYLVWRILAPLLFAALMIPVVGLATPDYWETAGAGEDGAYGYASAVFFAVVFALVSVLVCRAEIAWDDDGVSVRNFGRWRHWRWSEVAGVRATHVGVVLNFYDGTWAVAVAVQKPRVTFSVDPRVDRVVAAMLAARSGATTADERG